MMTGKRISRTVKVAPPAGEVDEADNVASSDEDWFDTDGSVLSETSDSSDDVTSAFKDKLSFVAIKSSLSWRNVQFVKLPWSSANRSH